ncbi:hypothetical protein [Streptomyces sp. P17]|uniref:hypothetical protein n=1 Tax=Streptomyces sp. P17 TaxID=3074716 RepID=UPI0028F3E3E7|nr:hypothetical protein [Streptomyces sp. P17]MDT9698145.1 hypothetical protein [Streptomyces sp. P17]
MAVEQLPARVREFANYLNGLMTRLDQGGGWCGVFWQRDPDGMQACLDGREVPPWDVVEALLQDLAPEYGPEAARAEAEGVRALHAAALLAYDTRPGGRDALGDRLDVMLREQRYAAERQAELARSLAAATTQEQAEALRLDLAWARDDHARATARCAELRARMTELDRRSASGQAAAIRRERMGEGPPLGDGRGIPAQGGGGFPAGGAASRASGAQGVGAPTQASVHAEGAGRRGAAQAGGTSAQDSARTHGSGHPGVGTQPGEAAAQDPASWATEAPARPADDRPEPPAPTPRQRKRRRGGARFAGMVEEDAAPVVVPPTAVPSLPEPPAAGRRTPRGARFAGAAESVEPAEPQVEAVDGADRREVAGAVERLVRLRHEGRSGEAHALLAEIAYSSAGRYPLLAVELQRAGLGADWATLLWEAASLPAERLVAAADALVAAGREADGEQLLRQGVVRSADEIGQAVLALAQEGRRREIRALLDAYVRVRAPEEAARSVAADPGSLVPLLLEAARGVSDERHWDLVHALRVAGFAA